METGKDFWRFELVADDAFEEKLLTVHVTSAYHAIKL